MDQNIEIQIPNIQGWFPAHVVDHVDGLFYSQLITGDWENVRITKPSQIRQAPNSEEDIVKTSFVEGDVVEVFNQDTHEIPSGWWQGEIKRMIGDIYFIHYYSPEYALDEMVEKNRIRPAEDLPTLNPDHYSRLEVGIPEQLVSWARTERCRDHLRSIRERTEIKATNLNENDTKLILLGESFGLRSAELILEVIFKNQLQVENLELIKQERIRELEEAKRQTEGEFSMEFYVLTEYIGAVIGPKGSNLAAIRENYGVQIRVDRESSIPEGCTEYMTKIKISGDSEEEVLRAKMESVVRRDAYPLERQEAKLFTRRALSDIKTSAEIVHLWISNFNPANQSTLAPEEECPKKALNIVGSENAIQRCKRLISEYLSGHSQQDYKYSRSNSSFSNRSSNSASSDLYQNRSKKRNKPKKARYVPKQFQESNPEN
eukprot:CAMPEP_0114991440 /NCGR_PEP_ID=MMETSP0216-20121206/11373_1 /TAXON_ID=223996 /ORGANISM="Protocruzia adherens, Strain Boccale" /LENGTH=430 /DNA_ID=CAMNT_0002354767 /DNA_START=14 /DNA_END=1306 /DNA_ORIENTATION=+